MKIEEGKFYRDASGRKVGPMRSAEVDGRAFFLAENTGYHYAENGRSGFYGIPDDTRKPLHLIAEVTSHDKTSADIHDLIAKSLQDDSDTLSPIREDRTVPVFVREGYDSLFTILCRALHQAQEGKGRERHANGKPFDQQPIMVIAGQVGMGFQTGQAIKKTVEAHGMVNRGDLAAAERELLGAINFLAAAVLRINRMAN